MMIDEVNRQIWLLFLGLHSETRVSGFILGKWARSGIMLGLTGWVITGPNKFKNLKKKNWIYFLGQVRQKVGVYKTGSVFYLFILNYKSCIGDISGKIGTPAMRDHFMLGKSPGNTWVAWEIEEFFFFY